MRRSMKPTLFLLLAASLVACGGSETQAPPPPPPTVSGTWTGIAGPSFQQLTITLVDNSGAVTGNGTIANTPTGTRALTGSGTFVNKELVMTLTSGTVATISIRANMSGNDTLIGTVSGSGFNNDTLILKKV